MDAIVLLPIATASPSPFVSTSSSTRLRRIIPPAAAAIAAVFPPARRRRRRLSVECRASSGIRGRTLSQAWDLPSAPVAATWMPRMEDLDATNMLLKQRIVFLGSPVETTTADFIISQLLLLDTEDKEKDIKLFINSPGGSITAGMGIYDAMKHCKADISTVCFGLAASMGAFLLAAGTKGKRFCMPNARVMIHSAHGGVQGSVTEAGLQARELLYHQLKMVKTFSRITGTPESQIENDLEFDNFMSAWEAKEYGLVDAVIDDGKPGLIAPVVDLVPPPKTRIWHMWRFEKDKRARENLPSEHKFLQNGSIGSNGSDEKGKEQVKEESSPV